MPGFRPITPSTSYTHTSRENHHHHPRPHQLSPSKRTRSTLDDSTNQKRHSSATSSSSSRLQPLSSPNKKARRLSRTGISPRLQRSQENDESTSTSTISANGERGHARKNVFTKLWNRIWFPKPPFAREAEPPADATPPSVTDDALWLDCDMHDDTPSKRIPPPTSNPKRQSLYTTPAFPPAITTKTTTTTTNSQPRSSSKTIKQFSSKMAFPPPSKTAVALASPSSSSSALGPGSGRTLDPAFIAYEEARKAYRFDCTIARAKGVPEPEKPTSLRRPPPPQYLPQSSTSTLFVGAINARVGEGGQVVSSWRKKKPMGANKHLELNHRQRAETVHELATIALSQEEEDLARANDLDAYRRRVMQANEDMETAQTITSRARKPSQVARKASFKYSRDVDSVLSKAKATMETPRPESRTFKYDEYLETQRQLELLSVKPPKRRMFPRTLAPSDLATVKAIYANRSFVSSITGGEVRHKDVSFLQGLGWLNDETITFYGALINLRSASYHPLDPKKNPPLKQPEEKERRVLDVHAFNHNFFERLRDVGYSAVKRWSRRFDPFKKDRIIVPINQGGNHWVCAAVNLRDKRFEYFDSLGHGSKKVYKLLRMWMEEEYKARHGGEEIDLSGWEQGWTGGEVPLQGNGSDCGVFTCMYMETLSRDADFFDFEQSHMPYLRTKLVLEMSRRELIEEPWGEA
ncbi:BZ3500_MvSof-1268-A1-R1_Chr5-3g08339 [Microbotryum saponariae]|uniref:BZ3500_MvSof-1268-A1-R1_Chr5-3g08339 protein n=1 Tax=Microbotryum saponariae TaxID=289078 RepID=A0A2X0NRI8_9BASI|nr:BZ3500_MvSof-1268-A1-R1_Chr5-3g08339 [Microbotryum saponariae]SDA08447.1 BZ3501_MvSof-1269-A2-R1_Chr5-3g08067 [Microbotryum saponariae]